MMCAFAHVVKIFVNFTQNIFGRLVRNRLECAIMEKAKKHSRFSGRKGLHHGKTSNNPDGCGACRGFAWDG